MRKRDVVEYYMDVAEKMLPWLRDRPLTLVRAPEGPDSAFFQKDAKHFPPWFGTWEHDGVRYPVCNDAASLAYLAQLDTVEIHIPAFRAPKIVPEYVLFDMDPHPPATYADVATVALALRELFRRFRLRSLVKLSGKAGLHVILPVSGIDYGTARELARRVGAILHAALPDVVTLRYNTPGVLVDYNQNAWNKTMAAPFTLRLNGKVSLPLSWDEVEDPPDPTPEEARRREFPPPEPQDISPLLSALGLKKDTVSA